MTTARNWQGYRSYDPPSINWEPGSIQLDAAIRRLVVGRSSERLRVTIYNGTGADVTLWSEPLGSIAGYPTPTGAALTVATQGAIWATGTGVLYWFSEYI